MVLQSLLLCQDPGTQRVFRRALDELSIGLEAITDAESAVELLERNKFDAVVVDCDDVEGGGAVLAAIQQAPSNKRAIIIALINGTTSMRAAFEMGAHFALDKPVSMERALRALRAAHGFMVAEQRRYFRHAVDTTATLTFGAVRGLPCKVTNVSNGGMAIALTEAVSIGWTTDVYLELPGIPERIELKGEFAWSDGKGNAGIRFIYIPMESKKWLGKWLNERVKQEGPVLEGHSRQRLMAI
jgi:CheY-like chemotaxis protein